MTDDTEGLDTNRALALPLAMDREGTLTVPGVGSFTVRLSDVRFTRVGKGRALTPFVECRVTG